ncbi:AlpA family transcriptional regulator [Rodentibacter heylii]|nr:AlpA family transcriptional regulator [Rodentibacter heylii]
MQLSEHSNPSFSTLTHSLMQSRSYVIGKIMADTTNDRFLRIDEVIQMTGLSRSTIYDYSRCGRFPEAVDLGGNKRAWIESEVKQWMNDRIKQRNNKAKAGN